VYIVDDASTDDTPAVLAAKQARFPGSVVHLRREQGGQGKAHTLNHGLERALADKWTQAVLIMDADVVFTGPSLRRMARHLSDPAVGAVTAYIEEGSEPGNGLTRAISYEYLVAQAAARRAQNVIGALACLAGGAQLHTSSAALVALWLMDSDLARQAFAAMWIVNGLCFVFLVVYSLLIDPAVARRSWRRALMFPGLVSLVIVIATCFPAAWRWSADQFEDATGWSFNDTGERYAMLAMYLWVSLCMVAAYLVWRLDRMGAKRTAAALLWFVGFGPLLCAVTFTAYVKEAQRAEHVWDKTVKTGKVGARA